MNFNEFIEKYSHKIEFISREYDINVFTLFIFYFIEEKPFELIKKWCFEMRSLAKIYNIWGHPISNYTGEL